MSMTVYWICGVAVMALVTYLPRVLPLSFMRGRVNSPFLRSLLYYLPYAVLGAMTFPAILYSTATMWSALAGMAAALILSFMKRGCCRWRWLPRRRYSLRRALCACAMRCRSL